MLVIGDFVLLALYQGQGDPHSRIRVAKHAVVLNVGGQSALFYGLSACLSAVRLLTVGLDCLSVCCTSYSDTHTHTHTHTHKSLEGQKHFIPRSFILFPVCNLNRYHLKHNYMCVYIYIHPLPSL